MYLHRPFKHPPHHLVLCVPQSPCPQARVLCRSPLAAEFWRAVVAQREEGSVGGLWVCKTSNTYEPHEEPH